MQQPTFDLKKSGKKASSSMVSKESNQSLPRIFKTDNSYSKTNQEQPLEAEEEEFNSEKMRKIEDELQDFQKTLNDQIKKKSTSNISRGNSNHSPYKLSETKLNLKNKK